MGGEPFSHYELSYGYTGYGYTFGTRIDNPRLGEVTIGSLTANASYTFKMVAVNECGSGPWSNEFPVTLLPQKPPQVTPPEIKKEVSQGKLQPPTPAVVTQSLPTAKPTQLPVLGVALLALALLFLLLPSRWGMVFAKESKKPLANAQVILESQGRVVASKLTNRWGIYAGFKTTAGNYLLKVIYPQHQFAPTLEHERLNLPANYYPQELSVRSRLEPAISYLLPLVSPAGDDSTPVERRLSWQLGYHLVRAERALAYLQPFAFIATILLLLFTRHSLYLLSLVLYLLGIARRLVIIPARPPEMPPGDGGEGPSGDTTLPQVEGAIKPESSMTESELG